MYYIVAQFRELHELYLHYNKQSQIRLEMGAFFTGQDLNQTADHRKTPYSNDRPVLNIFLFRLKIVVALSIHIALTSVPSSKKHIEMSESTIGMFT
jgi:hypothetical protein